MQALNRIFLTVPLLVLATGQVHADLTASMPPEWKQASNGVPIEQIAPPKGYWAVSYNRLDRFNVDSQGLIINNAKADYNSQLGGLIHGNPRLQQSAKLILNEVTGTEPSSLRGPIEIAGDKADLIISNPNGLVINGMRFINIGRMTLTAAPPRDRDDILRVAPSGTNDADITIEGDGLDATGADSVDLYAQALHLNAKLYAHALSLRLGSQDIDYPSGKASPNEEVNLHQVLLDSSELGGMYADRINLVGSGVGLGVKLPSEVQVGGNFQISVEGEIQFLDTENLAIGGGDLMLQASSMDLPQLVKVGGNAQLTAKGDLRIHKMKVGENSGDGDLRLEAGELYNDDEVSVTGDIELQIEHRWHYNEGGTLRAPRGGVRITTSADRIRLPKKTRSDDCGFYCEDVETVTADIMRRTDADAMRPDYFRADSGTLVIENLQTLKNISADNSSGGVQMIPRVADNTQPDLVVVTTQVIEQYRNMPKAVGWDWGLTTRDFKGKKGIEMTRSRQDYRYDQLWELPKFPPDPPGEKWTLENIFKSWFGW